MGFNVFTRFIAKDDMSNPIRKMNGHLDKMNGGIKNMLGNFGRLAGTVGLAAGAFTLFKAQIDLDANLKSLQAITGVTGEQFSIFRREIEQSSDAAKIFKGDMASAFEIVGSAKSELLGNAEALGVVTRATITLSKASRDDLATSATNLVGVMNQFELAVADSDRAINVLSAGSVVGAANISLINESMKNFGAVANSSNITLEQSVALIEVLSKKSLFGAEAGTKLRGVTLKLQQANLGYASGQFKINDALEDAKKKMNSFGSEAKKDAFVIKTFGAENITAGKILIDNIDLFKKYTKEVTGTNSAVKQAEVNSSSLQNRLKELGASTLNFLTISNENTGVMSSFSNGLLFLADNVDHIIPPIIMLVGALGTLRIATIAVNVAMAANPLGIILLAVVSLGIAVNETAQEFGGWTNIMAAFGDLTNDVIDSIALRADLMAIPFQKLFDKLILFKSFVAGDIGLDKLRNETKKIDELAKLNSSLAFVQLGIKEDRIRKIVNTVDFTGYADNPEATTQRAISNREEINRTTTNNNNEKVQIEIVNKSNAEVNQIGESGMSNTMQFAE